MISKHLFYITTFVCLIASNALSAISEDLSSGNVKPYLVPNANSSSWELDFKFGSLRLYTDQKTNSNYWVFDFTVRNSTSKDIRFSPSFTLMTDRGDLLESNRKIPLGILKDIKHWLGIKYLLEPDEMRGIIKRGRDNELKGFAVWPAKNTKVKMLSLFIRGISGDSRAIKSVKSGKDIFVYRTLQAYYRCSGSDATLRGSAPLEYLDQNKPKRWIYR